jgi:hypothetical protein
MFARFMRWVQGRGEATRSPADDITRPAAAVPHAEQPTVKVKSALAARLGAVARLNGPARTLVSASVRPARASHSIAGSRIGPQAQRQQDQTARLAAEPVRVRAQVIVFPVARRLIGNRNPLPSVA